jgi:hypothetical protein
MLLFEVPLGRFTPLHLLVDGMTYNQAVTALQRAARPPD